MKKSVLFLAMSVLIAATSSAQLKKVYETKCSAAADVRATGNFGELRVIAGVKNFNVVQISDGKLLMDKKYSDAGSTVDKVYDAQVCSGILVVCNTETTVAGIDLSTGKKAWEVNSFKEIGNDLPVVLRVYDKYALVSDKKGKGNYALTAIDITNGKVLWTIENEKQQINLEKTIYIDIEKTLCLVPNNWSERKNAQNIRFVNIETGKTEFNAQVTGWITSSLDSNNGYLVLHSYVNDDNATVTTINVKEKKVQWSSKLTNKTFSHPMVAKNEYYVSLDIVKDKVIVATQGIEAFDLTSGKSAYNVKYQPYVEWGVGHYINSVFEPISTEDAIIFADATDGDIAIKKIEAATGKELWSTGKLKKMEVAPKALVYNNTLVVQFGGAVTFEVVNNTGIGKVLDPGAITGIDLQTGKVKWNLDKEVSYDITSANENTVVAFGVKNLQFIDVNTGAISSSQKEPFKETYFITKVGVSRVKYQKSAAFDMANRYIIAAEDDSYVKYTF